MYKSRKVPPFVVVILKFTGIVFRKSISWLTRDSNIWNYVPRSLTVLLPVDYSLVLVACLMATDN